LGVFGFSIYAALRRWANMGYVWVLSSGIEFFCYSS